ncbi:MAG: hypothetical protein JW896_03985 [Deltaproteobacteria bacterium]|nr:hypothetical protein [Deltaproteobacteria bacterium]
MTTSITELKQEINRLAEEAWVALGMPFDFPEIEEKDEGIIDVEALIIATLLVMRKDRLVTDLPAWINRFSNLINFQKLKTIFRGLSKDYKRLILTSLENVHFHDTPKMFRNVFDLRALTVEPVDESVRLRISKINTVENVAQMSLMIKNRLLYGTGFRADIITLTHIENISMKGVDLAALLCVNNSTISRILSDLKACGFIDRDKERIESFESYPGMFISVLSVRNLCEMMDSTKFSSEDLRRGVLENISFKNDAFSSIVLNRVL